MAPMAHRDGVSNASPIEETTVTRADGSTEEVTTADVATEEETPVPRKRAAKRVSK